jgi:histidine triad (HIT) family protein
MCIFCKIVKKEIPAQIVYENDQVLAFRDINPQAPVHILIIPKQHIEYFTQVKDHTVIAQMAEAAQLIAKKEGLEPKGYRLVINNGVDAGQEVLHIHAHLLGGRKMSWPPG